MDKKSIIPLLVAGGAVAAIIILSKPVSAEPIPPVVPPIVPPDGRQPIDISWQ